MDEIETLGDTTLNLGGDMEYNSVTCLGHFNCTAGGYYTGASGDEEAFVASEVDGTWQPAIEVPGIATLNAGGSSAIFTVSCAVPTSCTGVGNYADATGNQQAFVVDEVNGTWASAEEAPGTAALNVGGLASLNDVACTSPGNCDAGGYYSQRAPTQTTVSEQPFVIDEVAGEWNDAQEVPGSASLNVGTNAQILSTSCSTFENCVDAGYYVDASGTMQAFTVSESFVPATDTIRISVIQVTKVVKHVVSVVGLKLIASGLSTATGVVKFSSGSTALCSGTIVKGVAKCSTSRRLAKGSLSLTAAYAGDQLNKSASTTTRVVVK